MMNKHQMSLGVKRKTPGIVGPHNQIQVTMNSVTNKYIHLRHDVV